MPVVCFLWMDINLIASHAAMICRKIDKPMITRETIISPVITLDYDVWKIKKLISKSQDKCDTPGNVYSPTIRMGAIICIPFQYVKLPVPGFHGAP